MKQTDRNYQDYFFENEVKNNFQKEFVSLWPGWLGKENLYKLDEVSENDWDKFNKWILCLSQQYQLLWVDSQNKRLSLVDNIETTFSTYKETMMKNSSQFSRYVVPILNCVVSEDWDYTWIIWHQNDGAVRAISNTIKNVGLFHFK